MDGRAIAASDMSLSQVLYQLCSIFFRYNCQVDLLSHNDHTNVKCDAGTLLQARASKTSNCS